MNTRQLLIFSALGAGLYLWWRQGQGAPEYYEAPQEDFFNPFAELTAGVESMWAELNTPEKYKGAIVAAEVQYGIPSGLLARLLYQESRFREDIITGATRSPVGALGIAQFMPATARDMGIDPLDPFQAIPGAARYLSSLHRSTGSWELALAAYNWGIGNVTRKGMDRAPLETRNYVAQITADVPIA